MRPRAAFRRERRLSRSWVTRGQLLAEQRVGALQFVMPQQQALDSVGEFFDLRHGAPAGEGWRIVGGAAPGCLECRVGARDGVHAAQLNGKQGRRRRPAESALPPQRYGGREASSASPALRTCHWRREALGRSPGSLRQPGYRPTSGRVLVPPMSQRPRGSGRLPLAGASPMLCHLAAPRPALLRRRRRLALPVSRHSRTLRRRRRRSPRSSSPRPASRRRCPRQRRPRRDRRRDDPPQQRRFDRGPAAARGRPADRAQRRPGPERGLPHPRRQHEQHRRSDRRRSRRLGDARPGRVRSVQPGPDRAHRGAARAGFEPVRCRRRRRRDPDLHAAWRGRAALQRGGRGRRLPLAARRPGASGASVPSTMRSRSAASAAAASRRSRRATCSAASTRTATASSATRRSCGSASRRRRATASASPCSRPALTPSTTRPITPPLRPTPRPTSATAARAVAALDYRGALTPAWTTTLQVARSRRPESGGSLRSASGPGARRPRGRPRSFAPGSSWCSPTSASTSAPRPGSMPTTVAPQRRGRARLRGQLRRARPAGRSAPRPQLRLRRRHDRPLRQRRSAGPARCARWPPTFRRRASTTSSTRLRRRDDQPRRGRSVEPGRTGRRRRRGSATV